MKPSPRSAFEHYLRTGRRLPTRIPIRIEQKFNPNHDEQDGRFTYAPGGQRLPGRGVGSSVSPDVHQSRVPARPPSRTGIGGNSGPSIYDPMTLQQVFPRLATSVAGSIVAPIDSFMSFTEPAEDTLRELTLSHSRQLIAQIRVVDPNYRFQSLGEPTTIEGQGNQIRGLRLDRAEAFYRMRGEVRPLQVEALRFLQARVDVAYEEGVRQYASGELTHRLSRNEAIGNFVDGQVRGELRNFYRNNRISTARGLPVQVNRRAHNTPEGSYTVPDSRVGNVAFDVSLTAKTLATRQVQNFFRSDFQPAAVVIVRPTQLGPNSTYIITKPAGR